MKNLSTADDTSLAIDPEITSRVEEGKLHTLFKKIETIEPFFVRKMPLWKRSYDIIGSIYCLILFSPLFLITALIIKTVSPGPVFFKQRRIGYGGKEFTLLKFRTMKMDADESIHTKHLENLHKNGIEMNKLENDSRVIPFGKILRVTCLDELPQLINVLIGEMSLVGPRPDPVYSINNYQHWYKDRFDVLPGMTGLWQVSGKNRLNYEKMMRLDIAYAKKRSIRLDFKILLITMPAIFANARYDS